MNARVLDVAVTLSGELLAEVRAVLVLDVLDDRVPAGNMGKVRQSAIWGWGVGSTHQFSLLIWSP